MKNLIKSVKKLSPKKDDLLVVTIPSPLEISHYDVQLLIDALKQLKLKSPILLLQKGIEVKIEESKQGKHKVYLNNLEYLEYLSEKKSNIYNW